MKAALKGKEGNKNGCPVTFFLLTPYSSLDQKQVKMAKLKSEEGGGG